MSKVMKNCLLGLLWAILLVPVSAQRTLPNSLEPYVGKLNSKVVKALKLTDYDLPSNASLSAKPKVQSRSNALQLDSTISYYGYDFVGTADTVPNLRTNFEYPHSDVQIQTELQFENNVWLPDSRSTIYSDDQKRIVEVFSEVYDVDKGDFVPDSKALAFPHGSSQTLIDSILVYGMDSLMEHWVLIFFSTNKFDAQNRLIESISSFDYLGQPLLFKDVHSYNSNGDNILIESAVVFNGGEIPSGKSELEYQNHLQVKVTAYITDGVSGYLPKSKTTYAYTNFDKEALVKQYEWDFAVTDWVLTQTDIYEYDNAKRQRSKETVSNNLDGMDSREMVRYDYVEDENLASEAYYRWDGDYILTDRKFYYYSDGTLGSAEPLKTTLPLIASPNPGTGLITLNLDVPALIRVYNTRGELVHSSSIQPQSTLNLQDLPSGLYFITARTGVEAFAGRLVKE